MDEEQKKRTETASAFRNAMELDAKLRREEELRERERQAAEEKAAYQAREEYAKELAEEKVDLIRAKQGLLGDEAFQREEEERHYTLWQRIGNWFYHSKWWLGIASFLVLVTAFLVYDYVTREDPDLRVLLLTENPMLYAECGKLTNWLAPMCADANGDGESLVQAIYIPVSENSMEHSGSYAASYNSQLLIQFQTNTCMLVLVDDASLGYLQPEDMFVDLESLYPDCPFADGYRIYVDQPDLAQQLELTEPLNAGSSLTLRIPAENMNSLEENQQAYDAAKALLDQIVPRLHEKGADHG